MEREIERIIDKEKCNRRYVDFEIQQFISFALCILTCVACWFLIVPEVYRVTQDMNSAYAITALLGFFACHMIFNFSTK